MIPEPTPAPAPPPRRKFPVWAWLLVGVGGLFAAVLCAIVVIGVLTLMGSPTTTATTVIRSTDGLTEVTVPDNWREMDDLNDSAELQAANARLEQYLVVLTESKADFADDDLAAYADLISNNMVDGIDDAQLSDPETLEVQGQPALQYRLEGSVDNINVVYWITAVEGAEHFHQVIVWTLASRADANEQVLKDVTNSFREVPESSG